MHILVFNPLYKAIKSKQIWSCWNSGGHVWMFINFFVMQAGHKETFQILTQVLFMCRVNLFWSLKHVQAWPILFLGIIFRPESILWAKTQDQTQPIYKLHNTLSVMC